MMKNLHRITIVLIFFLVLNPVGAQINHGGKPMMNNDDFSPSRVLYLMESEDPILLEGLKSTIHNSYKKALHYAIERPVDISPEENGEWVEKDGVNVWRAHLISPEAYSVGVLFSEFELNEDASVFLYTPDGNDIKGSFTSESNKDEGSFFVGHLQGDEVIIELQVRNVDRDYGRLRIGLLSHAFLPVFAKGTNSTGLGTSQECEIDINCIEGDDWQTIKRAVCHISTPSLLCTGTLVNNTSYNGKPYVLTAEHCINKEFNADGSVFYFKYENSGCDSLDATKDKSVSGSTLIATGGALDFTLLKLSETPPREYNVYFAGWDVREKNHSKPVVLHHPNGDAMKISKDYDATLNAVSVPGDLNDYIITSNFEIEEWDVGTTEGGSSGSPLFNSSKRLIGVLSGGLAMCGSPVGYDEENDRVIYSLDDNRYDYFSKLYFDWEYYSENNKQLKKWLDPIGSGQLSIGGLAMSLVDVNEQQLPLQNMTVYPNPSDGFFVINLPEYTGRELNVEVYDQTGRLRMNQGVRSVNPVQITLNALPAGIYLIKVSDDQKRYSQRLIIK